MFKYHADRIVSISAILVSLGTLFIIVYQTNLARKAQKAQVFPYLTIALSISEGDYRIMVANTGLGPALIKSVEVVTGEEVFEGDPYFFAREQLGEDLPGIERLSHDMIMPGRLIPANYTVFTFTHSAMTGEQRTFIVQNFKFTGT